MKHLWQDLVSGGQAGGAIRVDATHPLDLYLALDAASEPGLVLITQATTPAAPRLEAIEVTETMRADGRLAVGIWLRDPALIGPFEQLCGDLIESTRNVESATAPGFLLSRLRRWQSLLDEGPSGTSLVKLRGLMGELLVFRECLEHWDPVEVVDAWVGPLEEPQDFAFAERVIEVKSVYPTARTARINSIAQLDADREELLAVVTIATILPEARGTDPFALASELHTRIERAGQFEAASVFMSHVNLTLSLAEPYRGPRFRHDGTRYYEVRSGFPRLRRIEIAEGVVDARYDILLAECAPFAQSLRR